MSDRFSLVCDNGCGVCGVKVIPFETYRSETFDGQLLASEVEPNLVSTCCSSPVSVYDNLRDVWLDGGVFHDRRA
jgi:hypothetical protein